MTNAWIQLDTIDKVKDFVTIISSFESDFDMRSGRYTVDGKSILGIFSLDLTRPIELLIYDDGAAPTVLEKVSGYLVRQS